MTVKRPAFVRLLFLNLLEAYVPGLLWAGSLEDPTSISATFLRATVAL